MLPTGSREVPNEPFETFAVGATPMLFKTAWLLTRDRHAAEDLVQETLVKVFPRWERSGPGVDNPYGYARTTLLRTFLKARKRRSSSEVPVAEPDEPRPQPGHDPTLSVALTQELMRLPSLDRAILVLRYYEDQSVAEVGEQLSLTESAVRSRASRAVAVLRSRLSSDITV